MWWNPFSWGKSTAPNTAPTPSPSGRGYSARFLAFMPLYLDFEGGLCDDKGDTGGLTNFGIDHASHPGVDIRNLTREGAMTIYWADWQRLGIERMSKPLGEVYFDTAQNLGRAEANEILEREGGWLGYLNDRRHVYRLIAANHSNDQSFLKDWLTRCDRLQNFCEEA